MHNPLLSRIYIHARTYIHNKAEKKMINMIKGGGKIIATNDMTFKHSLMKNETNFAASGVTDQTKEMGRI